MAKKAETGLSKSAMKVVIKLVSNSNLGQLKDAIASELEAYSDNLKQKTYLEVIEFAQGRG